MLKQIASAVLSTAPPKPVQRHWYHDTGTRIGSDQAKMAWRASNKTSLLIWSELSKSIRIIHAAVSVKVNYHKKHTKKKIMKRCDTCRVFHLMSYMAYSVVLCQCCCVHAYLLQHKAISCLAVKRLLSSALSHLYLDLSQHWSALCHILCSCLQIQTLAPLSILLYSCPSVSPPPKITVHQWWGQ